MPGKAAEEAAEAKKEARVRTNAKAGVQPSSIDDDEYIKYYLSVGGTRSSNASNATTSSEEVTSIKRLREEDEAGPSKKK
jgi:hypothetical protein